MTDVTHPFSSAKSDGTDATKVRPTNWNKAHVGALEILDRDLTEDEVVSSTTEESVYSYAVTAGKMGDDGGLHLRIGGDLLVNNAGTLILKIRFGPTATALLSRSTMFVSNTFDIFDSATRYSWDMDLLVMNVNNASQVFTTRFNAAAAATGNYLELVDTTSNLGIIGAGIGTDSEDTTAALTLDLTALWSVSHANLSIKRNLALMEFIPAS